MKKLFFAVVFLSGCYRPAMYTGPVYEANKAQLDRVDETLLRVEAVLEKLENK